MTPEPAPPEETRRAVPAAPAPPPPPTKDVKIAQQVLPEFDMAKDTDTRLGFISNPAKHRSDLERFFETLDGPLGIGDIMANPGDVTDLQSRQAVQLFRSNSRRCPTGAMLRLRENTEKNGVLIDWPLFSQSHNYTFDTFANSAGEKDQKPQWFIVLCKLNHDFELSAMDRENYFALDAQGSLSAAGTAKVYVHKNSVAGRYMTARMEWGNTYLSEVLLGKAELSGKTVNVILDCVGTGVERN
jgi:hypothetical protein